MGLSSQVRCPKPPSGLLPWPAMMWQLSSRRMPLSSAPSSLSGHCKKLKGTHCPLIALLFHSSPTSLVCTVLLCLLSPTPSIAAVSERPCYAQCDCAYVEGHHQVAAPSIFMGKCSLSFIPSQPAHDALLNILACPLVQSKSADRQVICHSNSHNSELHWSLNMKLQADAYSTIHTTQCSMRNDSIALRRRLPMTMTELVTCYDLSNDGNASCSLLRCADHDNSDMLSIRNMITVQHLRLVLSC